MYKGLAWTLIFVCGGALLGRCTLAAQSCGSRDTTIVLPNNQLVRTLTISDYINDDLADPQQGLCAVELNFVHQYVENLELTLTSPAGQMVQLIGPNSEDQFDFTLFTQWRISFVPCSETAQPDEFFAPRWDNEQAMNWASGGRYSGSYYPYAGCLEDFDFGPVNGVWTLTVNNNPSSNPGAITAVRLVFCDSRGVECCAADGGLIRNDDILACAGTDTLDIRAVSRFPSGLPDTLEYAYTYALARNGTIMEWDSLGQFDLRAATPATYEICGLSYRRSQRDSLPTPLEQPHLSVLRENLAGLTPEFCGDFSDDCQTVTIVAPPDTTLLNRRICAGDSVAVGDSTYRASGRYWVTLPGFAACDSVVQLDLRVEPAPVNLLSETICAGDSILFGSTHYRASGTYRDTLATAELGCDSIVTLELEVLEPLMTRVEAVICAGSSFAVGDSIFQDPGTYTVPLMSIAGCDSLLSVDLEVLAPTVGISGRDTLDCVRPETTLRRVSQQAGQTGSLRWTDAADNLLGTGEEISITTGGWYYLELTQSSAGVNCSARDSFLVTDLRVPLVADAGMAVTIDCRSPEVELGGNSSTGPDVTYQWSAALPASPDGPTNLPTLTVDEAGTYQLIVSDTRSRCADTSQVIVRVDTLPPDISIGPGFALNCYQRIDTLDGSNTDLLDRQWTWTGPCVEEELPDARARVSCAGWYTLRVENTQNGCVRRDSVQVTEDFTHPRAEILPPDTLNCDREQVVLSAAPLNSGLSLDYEWILPDGSRRTSEQLSSGQPGTYELILLNPPTGCRDTSRVQLVIDTIRPQAGSLSRDTLNCRRGSVTLAAAGISTGPTIRYQWFEDDNPVAGGNGPQLTVTEPASYRLEVTDMANACRDTAFTRIDGNFAQPPFFALGPDQEFSCGRDSLYLFPDSVATVGLTLDWAGPCLVDAPAEQWARIVTCPGTYSLRVSRLDNGCSSSDSLRIGQATDFVQAILPDSTRLSCVDATAIINTDASSTGQYRWTRNGIPISLGDENPLIGGPGEYRLIVENSLQTCADTALTVAYFACNLNANIALPPVITCDQQSVLLDAGSSTGEGPITYAWRAPVGCYLGELDGPTLEVLCAGTYQLVLTQPVSGLSDTASVTVAVDNSLPQVDLPAQLELSCTEPVQLVRPVFSGPTAGFTYRWTDLEENVLATTDTLSVGQTGTYVLEVTDSATGCSTVRFITVRADSNLPTIAIGSDVFPCEQDTFVIQAFLNPPGVDYDIAWSGPAIRGATDQASVTVESTGLYEISVRNPDNGCQASLRVDVVPQSCEPCIQLALPDTLGCDPAEVTLLADLCASCTDCSVRWFRDGNLIPAADSLRLFVTEVGSYRVQLTDSQGLVATAEVTVTRFPEIAPFDFGPPRLLTCANEEIVLTSPAPPPEASWGYRWERVADNLLLGTDSSQVVTAAGNYRLTVRDENSGCTYSAIARVAEGIAPPLAEAGPDLRLDCDDNVVIPQPDGSTLSGVTYLWTGPANCISGATALRPALSCPGTYYLTVRRNDNGCTATDSLVVDQSDELPVLAPLPDTTLTCGRSSLLLRGSLPSDGGDYEPRWCQLTEEGEELTFTCQFTTSYTVDEGGTYQFTVTNLATGCSSAERVEVLVDTLPPLAEAGMMDTLLCNTNRLSLAGQAPPGAPLRWQSADGYPIVGATTLEPAVTQAGWYTLEVTDPVNGCVGRDSVRVLADERRPELRELPDTVLSCAQPQLQLGGVGTTTSGLRNWEWLSLDGQEIEDPANPSLNVSLPGTYVLLLIDPANDCRVADTVRVRSDFRQPLAVIDSVDQLQFDCRTDTLQLNALNSTSATGTGLAYQWSIQGSGNLFPDLRAAALFADRPGLYRLVVTDEGNGCRDSLSFQLRGDFRSPNFTLPADLLPLSCTRDSVLLTALTSLPADELTFSWQAPGGAVLSTADTALARQPGTYVLTLTRQDNACSRRDSVTVRAEVDFPFVQIAAPADLSCQQPTVVLDGSLSQTGPTISYRWDVVSGGPLLGTTTSPVDSVARSGTYLLTVFNSANGCSSQDSVQVVQIDNPITQLEVEALGPACPPGPLGSLSVQGITGGTPPFTYQLAGDRPSLSSFFEDLTAGAYALTVTDALGCSFSEVYTLLPAPDLLLELGADREVLLGDSIRLEPELSREVMVYNWQARQPLSGSSPVLRPRQSQFVSLSVMDSLGCRASDTLFVTVVENLPVFAPTAFSPRGSGQNAYFTLYGDGKIAQIRKLQIFSRWGNVVFERTNFAPNQPTLGWDGRVNGQVLNSAVFVWLAEIERPDGEVFQISGDVLLMR